MMFDPKVQLSPDNYPGVILVLPGDGYICRDYAGADSHLPECKPVPNAIMTFASEALALEYNRIIAANIFKPKTLSWKDWLSLAAKSLREGLIYYTAVILVSPHITKGMMELSKVLEIASAIGGITTDGQHRSC
jgi:hypothetical protein